MIPLSMDLVRVTEAAAIAASAWVGTGEKELADKAATDAMRDRLNRIHFAARVVIGEGKKDGASACSTARSSAAARRTADRRANL